MRETGYPFLLRYGIPVVSALAALLLTAWLQPLLTPGRSMFFLAAVVVGAWFGGLRGGLLATLLGAVGHAYLLLLSVDSPVLLDRGDWIGLALFVPVAVLISWLIEALHDARRQAQGLTTALRLRVLELAEADQRKDEFLAVLGHELRNPLAPICDVLHVLHLREDAPTVLWARGVVERQVHHLSRLVDDLLDSARVNHGKILLHREPIDLVRLVRDTLDDYAPELEAAGLTLRRDLCERPAWVEGDATRLSQVLTNLLHNAIKFTDRGGQVAVRLALDSERRRAAVTVHDTGIGIEPALLPRVFETYAQGESSRGRGGLGLGLALVKALVELHGGAVRAASDGPGCGTEFSFWLPLPPRPASGTPMPSGAGEPPSSPVRILVIEDNRDAAESLRLLLGLFGHEVAVAHSGPAGVALARQFHPDAVLCDLGLPGMDGYAVARALRQDPLTASTGLLALSGYGGEEDRRRSRESGFDLHLTKPVDVSEIEQLLASLVRGAAATGRRPEPPGAGGSPLTTPKPGQGGDPGVGGPCSE